LSVALLLGVAVGVTVNWFFGWKLALLAGWDGFVLGLIVQFIADIRGHTPASTAAAARRDDIGHSLLDVLVTTAALASLGAVFFMLTSGTSNLWRIGFGLISIVLSWAVVHTLYTLRYAALYYADKEGGIDFGSNDKPVFTDFAYVAFTIGMTYQVSDTTMKSSEFRRLVLQQALLSFVFGTAIIATTINFVAGLVQ
jgi:uncharacterized membrane protein